MTDGAADLEHPRAHGVRNLVVCCDGTGNIWGNHRDTNVVKLVRSCAKDPSQIVYYDPGVGTASQYPGIGPIETAKVWAARFWGLAFGGGIYDDIGSAYAFLIRSYRPGDRIWVFGFSRGAFAARAVAGMVNLFGVVRPAAEVMIPTLLRTYFSDRAGKNRDNRTRDDLANDIRANFTDPAGHEARVYFTGVWDTVASVGGLRPVQISSPLSAAGKRFDHIRHAVSTAEYRVPYDVRKYPDDENRDEPGLVQVAPNRLEYRPGLKQLYFPGVHSDVGGSYAEQGLSDCTLSWMLDEARSKGLRLVPGCMADIHPDPLAPAHDAASDSLLGCLWALAGLQRRPPEPTSLCHPSLTKRLADSLEEGAPQRPLLSRSAFWVSLAIVLVLGWLLSVVTARLDPSLATSAWDLALLQLSAASATARNRLSSAYHGDGLGWILGLDVIFIAAYLYILCTVSAWSVRHLRHWRAESACVRGRLRWVAQLPLLVGPGADLAEDWLTWAYVSHADGWSDAARGVVGVALNLCSAVKFGALLTILALALFALVLGRSHDGRRTSPSS